MVMLDDVQLRTQLESPRPYAAELGIPFDRELTKQELVALLVAEHLENVFHVRTVLPILRWMGGFITELDVSRPKPPEVLTVLDYRWVISLGGAPGIAWDTKICHQVHLQNVSANEPPPEVSLAINLWALWLRRVRPMINQSRD